MQDNILILIIGAVIGSLGTLLLELVRNRLENNRLVNERGKDSAQARERGLRDFLTPSSTKKIAPSWLKLVQTRIIPPFFRKEQTVDKNIVFSQVRLSNGEVVDIASVTIEKFILVPTQVIGRQEDCEIRLSDSAVSRIHALVRYEEGNFVIYDLGSKSGSYVNSKKVGDAGTILYNGDRLEIGESAFIFEGTKVNNQKRKNEGTTKTLIKDKANSKSGNE